MERGPRGTVGGCCAEAWLRSTCGARSPSCGITIRISSPRRSPEDARSRTPTLLLGLAFVALVLLLGFSDLSDVVRTDRGTFADRWGSPAAAWSVSGAIRLFYSFGLPVLVAGACCFVAGQRRVPLRWPLIGVVMVALVGAATQFDVVWPYGPEADGALGVTIRVPPFPGSGGTVLRAAATCALTLGPFLWWRTRMARRAADS